MKTPIKKYLVDAAKEELEKLTAKINESTLVGVLNGDTRVAVVVVEGSNNLTVQSNLLKKAYDTATGRLLIASLPDNELLLRCIGRFSGLLCYSLYPCGNNDLMPHEKIRNQYRMLTSVAGDYIAKAF